MIYSPNPERLEIERRESELEYPFADDTAEPDTRYCWRCEVLTRQVSAESVGAVWWMCLECNETQKDNQ